MKKILYHNEIEDSITKEFKTLITCKRTPLFVSVRAVGECLEEKRFIEERDFEFLLTGLKKTLLMFQQSMMLMFQRRLVLLRDDKGKSIANFFKVCGFFGRNGNLHLFLD